MTASQPIKFDNECAFPVHSQVIPFVAVINVNGNYTRFILWPDGRQSGRK